MPSRLTRKHLDLNSAHFVQNLPRCCFIYRSSLAAWAPFCLIVKQSAEVDY